MKFIVGLISLFFLISCTDHAQIASLGECGGDDSSGVIIDPQPFFMGSSNSLAYGDESPVHSVFLTQKFIMDSTEVTQKEFSDIMNGAGFGVPLWSDLDGRGDNYPAYNVSWGDAVLFCNAKSKLEGLDTVYTYTGISKVRSYQTVLDSLSWTLNRNGYRLPTEAEWEYACRASSDTTQDFYWGNDTVQAKVELYSWYKNSAQISSDNGVLKRGVREVATRVPNAFGLYDMSGNVSEWCCDYFSANYYSNSPSTDPINSIKGSRGWVVRGGHWTSTPRELRSSFRDGQNSYANTLGFRTVRNWER